LRRLGALSSSHSYDPCSSSWPLYHVQFQCQFGFFALAQGKRIATYLPGATFPIHHVYYVTSLKTSSDDPNTYPAATLCVYTGSGDVPLADNTVAFVVAKVSALTGPPPELDALHFSSFPGDPNSNDYDMSSMSSTPYLTSPPTFRSTCLAPLSSCTGSATSLPPRQPKYTTTAPRHSL
jgi:hypothetical protein